MTANEENAKNTKALNIEQLEKVAGGNGEEMVYCGVCFELVAAREYTRHLSAAHNIPICPMCKHILPEGPNPVCEICGYAGRG